MSTMLVPHVFTDAVQTLQIRIPRGNASPTAPPNPRGHRHWETWGTSRCRYTIISTPSGQSFVFLSFHSRLENVITNSSLLLMHPSSRWDFLVWVRLQKRRKMSRKVTGDLGLHQTLDGTRMEAQLPFIKRPSPQMQATDGPSSLQEQEATPPRPSLTMRLRSRTPRMRSAVSFAKLTL